MCASSAEDTNIMKNRTKLKKILELEYGFLDELVSQGMCDLEQVKNIENTHSSTLHRKKIVKDLAEKLTSSPGNREQIIALLKRNGQHHVAELIKHDGCKYNCSLVVVICQSQARRSFNDGCLVRGTYSYYWS